MLTALYTDLVNSYKNIFSSRYYFICNNCGYKSNELNWMCPSCNTWETIVPKSAVDIIEDGGAVSNSHFDNNQIIVALDYDNKKQALELSEKLDPSYCRLKIGKQLFTKYGPTIVDELQKMNFEIFLDLKFHDIPLQFIRPA